MVYSGISNVCLFTNTSVLVDVDTLVFSDMCKQSSALWSECPVYVRIPELLGMARASLSYLCLLLLDFQLSYGGIVMFLPYDAHK